LFYIALISKLQRKLEKSGDVRNNKFVFRKEPNFTSSEISLQSSIFESDAAENINTLDNKKDTCRNYGLENAKEINESNGYKSDMSFGGTI